jgi:acetyltransferase
VSQASASKLAPLFEPRAVAVVGVGEQAGGVGRIVFDNLRSAGFARPLYAINRRAARVAEVRAWPSVGALPERVELAVIAVPAASVPDVLDDCGRHGVRFAIVLSAGFAETGSEGTALLARAVAAARSHGLRVVGPNCLGLLRGPSALNASFARGLTRPGKLALVSQSGAICSALVDWAEARQIGFSTVLSLGAAADVSMGEVLEYLALDAETDAILLYVEGLDHARSFMDGLRAAASVKPVIVVKAGRHPHASRAATSHTGSIVGDDAVFEAALRRAGAVRVDTLPELFSAAEMLSHAPPVGGDRLAIITNAGGLGVLATDRAEEIGVPLATLSEATRALLMAQLPAHAALDNPIDVLGDAAPDRFELALKACIDDPGVDGVAVFLTPQTMTRADEIARAVATHEGVSRTPIVTCFMGGAQVAAAKQTLVSAEVPCFESPEAAVDAFAALSRYRTSQRALR